MNRQPIVSCTNLACGKSLSPNGFEQVRLQPVSGKQPPIVLVLCSTCVASLQEYALDGAHGLEQK